MRIVLTLTLALFSVSSVPAAYGQAPQARPLDIYVVDVEGGQATLVVSPSGQSMLVDAGWPGFEGRDPGRIEAAMKQAGVSRIDFFVATHYHTDHVGGVPALAAKVPIGTFVDHGPTFENPANPIYTAYLEARKQGKHLQVKPGDTIPIAGLQVTVVTAGGEHIQTPLQNGGTANPLCTAHKPQPPDPSENARSVGVVIRHGNFRMVNLGDLTWNEEHELACPSNKVGPVDLYLTTHHGSDTSGPPVLVHALRPRVAIMNNGAKKGGSPAAWRIVRDSPGLQDFWQLHTAVDAGPASNTAEQFIANVDETTAHPIKVSASEDGSFTVTNTRNAFTKTYKGGGGAAAR